VKESIGTRYACTGGFGEVPSGFCAPSFEGVERLFVGSLGVAGSHAVEHQALDAGSGWVFFGAYERAAVPLRHAATASWSWTGTPGCCSANSTTRQLRDPDAERSQAMQAGVAGADGNQQLAVVYARLPMMHVEASGRATGPAEAAIALQNLLAEATKALREWARAR